MVPGSLSVVTSRGFSLFGFAKKTKKISLFMEIYLIL